MLEKSLKGGDHLLNDFEMIVHKFDTSDNITIYPISDVHLGSLEHMEREWSQFCIDLMSQPNTYITLGGDLINNATRTSVSNVFDETMRPREQKKIVVEMLTPIKDRILCAVTGNHERRSTKDVDDDPTYDIMTKLNLEHLYRENIAFVKIQLGCEEKRKDSRSSRSDYRPTYIMAVTHGVGTGRMTGGAVNRTEQFGTIIDGCDIFISGHTHKPFITQPSKIKIDPRNNRVSVVPFKVLSTSSWMNYGGYAAQKLLNPNSHAKQIITLSGYKKNIRVEM